jgi:hypothetical protein
MNARNAGKAGFSFLHFPLWTARYDINFCLSISSGILPGLSAVREKEMLPGLDAPRLPLLRLCFQPCQKFLPASAGQLRTRIIAVQANGFFQTVQVGGAARTRFKMFLDLAAFGRIEMLVHLRADAGERFLTGKMFLLHDFIYSFNCSRRNMRPRRNRDFTAGTVRFNIRAVSSVDCPSTSRRIKTTRYSYGSF